MCEKMFGHSGFLSGLSSAAAAAVRESAHPRYRDFAYTERHLQCLWADEHWRPSKLRSSDGEKVLVLNPGEWNLEAGPDFLGAVLLIGRGRRKVVGDVEVHIHPSDWTNHGHSGDPRYARVAAHVTYFASERPPPSLPSGSVQIALLPAILGNPHFSFECIDTTAYPYAQPGPRPPCADVLAGAPVRCAEALLDAAGRRRIEAKAVRIRQCIRERGRAQALYEETMSALGYKHNRAAFRELALRLPVRQLRCVAGGPFEAFAILLGVSGLMPPDLASRWDEDTRLIVRAVWNVWWKRRARFENAIMPAVAWNLGRLRPQNHPVRRIAAAASLFCQEPVLESALPAIHAGAPRAWIGEATALLSRSAPDPYWEHRFGFECPPQKRRLALVGPERAAAILCNVFIPFLAAAGNADALPPSLLECLRPEHYSGTLRRTARTLLGRDHNPAVLRSGLRQQGLLEVFQEFCLVNRSGCAACPLPAALRRWLTPARRGARRRGHAPACAADARGTGTAPARPEAARPLRSRP